MDAYYIAREMFGVLPKSIEDEIIMNTQNLEVSQWESLERNLRARKVRQETALKDTTLQYEACVKALEVARRAQMDLFAAEQTKKK